MVRLQNCRVVGCLPGSDYFKPRGVPLSSLEEVVLTVDEFEAIRLTDLEGLYQEQAAGRMSISRQTFGRIIESAHRKVAQALVGCKALKIEGGAVTITVRLEPRKFKCQHCRRSWEAPYEKGGSRYCPACRRAGFWTSGS